MSGIEVADPYVERLLEGFAFLAARVQLKLDAEFPRFTQTLLEIVYPHYLAPTPSMAVVQLKPDSDDPGLVTASRVVPRGTTMQSATTSDERTACEFRTAQDVPMWPIEVVSATYFSFAPDLPLNALPIAERIKGGVRIRLKTPPGVRFSQLPLDRLTFYLAGADDVANKLYELCLGNAVAVLVHARCEGRALVSLHARARIFVRSATTIAKRCCRCRCARFRDIACSRSTLPSRNAIASSKLTGLAPAIKRATAARSSS